MAPSASGRLRPGNIPGVTAMAARHAPGQRTPVVVTSQQASRVEVKLGLAGSHFGGG